MQLHADLERLLRAKSTYLTGMSLAVYAQLLHIACDEHSGDAVLQEALLQATEALAADDSDPLAPKVEIPDALVVAGQLVALPSA